MVSSSSLLQGQLGVVSEKVTRDNYLLWKDHFLSACVVLSSWGSLMHLNQSRLWPWRWSRLMARRRSSITHYMIDGSPRINKCWVIFFFAGKCWVICWIPSPETLLLLLAWQQSLHKHGKLLNPCSQHTPKLGSRTWDATGHPQEGWHVFLNILHPDVCH